MSKRDVASNKQAWAEMFLIFAVFFTQGAWPVPDVNEPYYLGKAIYFWNPTWAEGDFFLQTPDAHEVFCFTFGWLSRWLSPPALAWTGRLLTWALLAWAWRRMSFTYLPHRWAAVWTAALFVCLQERCQMAGEWVIGGVEAKGFAFVLVLLALDALGRSRWNWVWLLLGAASAFHVLVGGWAAVAALLAWASLGERRPRLGSMALAMSAGFLISLAGLVPALNLTTGARPETIARAYQIYVFGRLGHHLAPGYIPWGYIYRFIGLVAVWILLERAVPADAARRRLRAFVGASVGIAVAGMGISLFTPLDPARVAALLRFYWFRLSDVAVPLGVALLAGPWAVQWLRRARRWWPADSTPRPALPVAVLALGMALVGWLARANPLSPGREPLPWALTLQCAALAVAILFWLGLWSLPVPSSARRLWAAAPLCAVSFVIFGGAALHLGNYFLVRLRPAIPRGDRLYQYPRPRDRLRDYLGWREACRWIAQSGKIPENARFLTPRMSQTFKWHAGRPEVVNWKEIPQDPESIVEWWNRIHDIYGTGSKDPAKAWCHSLGELGAERLLQLGRKYGAQYVITRPWPWVQGLEVVYWNPRDPMHMYVIYRLRPAEKQ